MKKITAFMLAAAIVLVLLTGCGAKMEDTDSFSVQEMVSEGYFDADTAGWAAEPELGYTENAVEAPTALDTAQTADIERKIIKNADIEIEADDAVGCYLSILSYAKQLGGYESSCITRVSEFSDEKYVNIDAVIRIPPEKLDEFVSKAGDYGTLTFSNISQDEITDVYYDLTTRLASKQAALDEYYRLLEKAETVDDIITIQCRIDSITEEMESIKGRLRVYDSKVDESTVNLYISQYTPTPAAEKEFEWDSLSGGDFLKLIKNGFLSVCNFTWSLIQWLVIIAISLAPLLIIAAGVLFAVRYIRKKQGKPVGRKERAARRSAEAEAKAASKETEQEYNAPDYK